MNSSRFTELLLQSLEHERGGVKIYQTAIKCALRDDLRSEWQDYLAQTEGHVETLTDLCATFDIDPSTTTPGTEVVRWLGKSLLRAMDAALAAGNRPAAQIVAAECVVLAETKDHLNWELIGAAAKELSGSEQDVVRAAYERIEDEEDEHLYHTQGWCRELWLESLDIEATLPPPEEVEAVTTAAEAQEARQGRQARH